MKHARHENQAQRHKVLYVAYLGVASSESSCSSHNKNEHVIQSIRNYPYKSKQHYIDSLQ